MDIETAWLALLTALADREIEQAREHANDVLNWLNNGGFGLQGLPKSIVYGICRAITKRARTPREEL